MTAQLTVREMIGEALRNGRRPAAALAEFDSTLDAMARDGEVRAVDGDLIELTGRGWAALFGEDMVVSRLDQFADLLAMGFSAAHAGHELNLTPDQASAAFEQITAHLGAQAA